MLHYVYLGHINRMLITFIESLNNHPLRTEKNKSPLQICTEEFYGMPELIENTSVDVDGFYWVEQYLFAEEIETNDNVQTGQYISSV